MKIIFFIILLIVAAVVVYFLLGSKVTENLDSFIYDLPFKAGTKYRVVQGYGGRFSHSNKAALDFYMPEGTPVCAARAGVVYSFKDDSNEGGPLPKYEKQANYIIIKHEDGSYGCYWHLQQYGVIVKKGMVAKGQVIGYSGSTGFVLRPHLHFAVKLALNYQINSFVRTRFRTARGNELLESGVTYERPVN